MTRLQSRIVDVVYLTTPQAAEMLGVTSDKVLAWIKAGELRAYDVSLARSKRPRWRIAPDDLDAFLASRQATPPPPKRRPQRRKPVEVREYY